MVYGEGQYPWSGFLAQEREALKMNKGGIAAINYEGLKLLRHHMDIR
jgi:hypothetical protein